MNPAWYALYSEWVLSLYPILIKTVDTNMFTQILARFLVFPALAIAFGARRDWATIWTDPYEAFVGVLNGVLNLCHVGVSYLSFANLPAGTALSLFYLYPFFNLIAGVFLFGESISISSLALMGVAFAGVYLIVTSRKEHVSDEDSRTEQIIKHRKGVVMAILAALTETIIYVFVRWNKSATQSAYYAVNHLYTGGLALLGAAALFRPKVAAVDTNSSNWAKLIGFNALLGFTGYMARFIAIPKLSTFAFSILSFVGVAFGYLWGILFTDDHPTSWSMFGGFLIALSIAVLRYKDA